MPAVRINGKEMAAEVRAALTKEVEELKKKGITPGMATVLVGGAEDSAVYVRNKGKNCEAVGGYAELHHLSEDTTIEELMGLIDRLNKDEKIHGILVQLPLPGELDKYEKQVMNSIDPDKDIDAFHPMNLGNLMIGDQCYLGVTANACVKMLENVNVDFKGKHAVVVGWSIEIGKPVTMMLFERGCAVTLVHPDEDFAPYTKQADIIITELGKPKAITGDMIKPGAVVIDTGSNWIDGKTIGDVDYDSAVEVAGCITPVPGGVGPMRIIMLIYNLVEAAKRLGGV
ncbi:MAG TPA: bifunctional methylenetetrahydrofolate dehydrogenase/methenyltetrahydrofolate cyclohydrolase [Syntrophaceticus sp.]|mgnify:CR=1 FL=1|jgi:methylenetetrahydrofolate dehydrogenase (NADP+)/methenyltetrahydrofolate cyclohydrolase|nr:tetrahydrofolate dehydrogenase/cyclohydrolase catalytic domain-containing protein [Syntrophaceticus schinkii]MDD4261868.1 tetrahydrofolate dehydrogenase/cyclohydrolase catalytic domain-containing protein [Syntrophaceticus schinkii]MDD4674291.1 tetrahydrofolate dehydrogenase/cyclohydrolase catalytic domain-containing protein [Syntrophaceticus schinkii]HHY31000.1 bifunctional methylenetetrahydrofolate dehydrogenase/methenyltetrahydrofolate cyclohydrolase [Syntrophaceticus sp.]